MTAPNPFADSPWAARRPDLADAAEGWLARLPELLEQADRRADRILGTSVMTVLGVARFGQLAARTAPRVLPALARRDGDAAVRALGDAALRGGPTFVKLGQLVSTTKGIAPDWISDAFAGCRDAVPPASTASIESTLGRSGITERLRSWDRTPIASASVAQVHAATLNDGTEVVLKIRRPGIVRTVGGDMAWLLPALRIAEGRNDRMRIANLSATLELMTRLFAQEVDLRLEAANIAESVLAYERAGVDVELPVPVPGLITERVMAMERIEGITSADSEGVAALGHHAHELVRLAIGGVLETALVDGIFHGDLHPGNIMVTDRGLALLDFGIVGRLSPEQRGHLLALLVAAFGNDRLGIVRALHGFGALPADVDPEEFVTKLPPRLSREQRRAVRADRDAIGERIASLVRTLSENGFKVNPELSLFAKNLVYLGDAVQRHAPDFEMIDEVTAMVMRLGDRLAP